jgi:hypothetical protein
MTGAAVAAVVGLTAPAALATAATTYTVSPGGAYTAKAGKTTLKDTKTGTVLTCTSATAKGTLKKGSGLAGADIGSITSSGFNSCTGPLSLHFTVKQNQTWFLNVQSYTSSTGVSAGYIGKVKATLSGTGCTAVVTGATNATYKNSSGVLAVAPKSGSKNFLTIVSVNGCAGLIGAGDHATFTGSYTLSPKQKIT